MVDELSGGKMMYAFLRVTDPNTQLPKNVLVNWVSLPLALSLSLTILIFLILSSSVWRGSPIY